MIGSARKRSAVANMMKIVTSVQSLRTATIEKKAFSKANDLLLSSHGFLFDEEGQAGGLGPIGPCEEPQRTTGTFGQHSLTSVPWVQRVTDVVHALFKIPGIFG